MKRTIDLHILLNKDTIYLILAWGDVWIQLLQFILHSWGLLNNVQNKPPWLFNKFWLKQTLASYRIFKKKQCLLNLIHPKPGVLTAYLNCQLSGTSRRVLFYGQRSSAPLKNRYKTQGLLYPCPCILQLGKKTHIESACAV